MKRFRLIILADVIADNEEEARARVEGHIEPGMTMLDPGHLAMIEDPREADTVKKTRAFYERHTELLEKETDAQHR